MAINGPTLPLGTGIKTMTLVIQTNANFPAAVLLPASRSGNFVLNKLGQFFNDLKNGSWNSNVTVIQGGVYATIGATFASVVATDTLVIGGVTLTAVNSGATSVQFNVGATDTITAANAATAINALTTVNKKVYATSSGAVVTITALVPGTVGNAITTTAGGGTITVDSVLAGGTDGSVGFISHGL